MDRRHRALADGRRSPVRRRWLSARSVTPSWWAIVLNVFGKIQTISVLLAGALANGFGGVGFAVTAIGAAYLGSTLADFGFAAEMNRAASSNLNKQMLAYALRRLALQASVAAVAAPGLYWFTARGTFDVSIAQYISLSAYSAAYVATNLLVALLYASKEFAAVVGTLGLARLAAGSAVIAVSVASETSGAMLAIFAGSEMLAVPLMVFRLLRCDWLRKSGVDGMPMFRKHRWLGIAAFMNVLTNQSDALLVSSVLSPTAVGIFGLAGQVQNACTTLSVASAGPLPALIASSADPQAVDTVYFEYKKRVIQLVIFSLATVAVLTSMAAILGLPPSALHQHGALAAIAISAVSAVPSVLAFVEVAVAVGTGRHSVSGVTRSLSAVASIPIIYLLARNSGLYGACIATVIRDALLLVVCRIFLPRHTLPPTG